MKVTDLFAYINQRFPPINMALFAILFLTVYSVAHFSGYPLASETSQWQVMWGILAVISFFFRLRVSDEIKDYAIDAINHPHRVLQSGRVTLTQLQYLAMAGSLLELSWSVAMGLPTFSCWILALTYSFLMRYEFFISHYLKKRLVLYAFTHMLVMPLVIWWIWSAFVPNYGFTKYLFLLAGLSLLGGFSFEIARKLHVPDAEKDLIDSYSKAMGYSSAIITVLVILLVSVAVQSLLLTALKASLYPFLLIALLYLATVLVYVFSIVKPREKTLKIAEVLVSLNMLVSYLSIILVVFV